MTLALLGYTLFKEKILSGEKKQTIRKLRKHPIKLNERLYHYWLLRQRGCEKLGESDCTEVLRVMFKTYGLTVIFLDGKNRFANASETTELAKRDGFTSASAMFARLGMFHRDFELSPFQVIRWGQLEREASE